MEQNDFTREADNLASRIDEIRGYL